MYKEMYSVKKLFLGEHKTDDGRTWTGAGFAVVNEKGEILTFESMITHGRFIEVYELRKTAELSANNLNARAMLSEVTQ